MTLFPINDNKIKVKGKGYELPKRAGLPLVIVIGFVNNNTGNHSLYCVYMSKVTDGVAERITSSSWNSTQRVWTHTQQIYTNEMVEWWVNDPIIYTNTPDTGGFNAPPVGDTSLLNAFMAAAGEVFLQPGIDYIAPVKNAYYAIREPIPFPMHRLVIPDCGLPYWILIYNSPTNYWFQFTQREFSNWTEDNISWRPPGFPQTYYARVNETRDDYGMTIFFTIRNYLGQNPVQHGHMAYDAGGAGKSPIDTDYTQYNESQAISIFGQNNIILSNHGLAGMDITRLQQAISIDFANSYANNWKSNGYYIGWEKGLVYPPEPVIGMRLYNITNIYKAQRNV